VKTRIPLITILALAAPLVLSACGSGESYGGCTTTNAMSVGNGKVLATVTLECDNVPERHRIHIRMQFRDKTHPKWATAQDLTNSKRYAHHVFSLSNVCIPGEWRLYVSATATFKAQPVSAEGPSPVLNTVGTC
jgi:hypothetical protein